uniref:Metalloendopeptidase n=1 Tax=Xenopus tropicalis TaxID=8364 RepID=A0A6I8R978_XENTR
MDSSAPILLLLPWLLSVALTLPIEVIFPRATANETNPVFGDDVFGDILRANEGTNVLLRETDIAVPLGRNSISCKTCLWPKSTNGRVNVPYVFDEKYSEGEKSTIREAMKDFATMTCVEFVPKTAEPNYLSIHPGDGCWSFMGVLGGAQGVSLGGGCLGYRTIQHELTHALGFWHEQNRSDRNKYIDVFWQYISPDASINYQEMDTNNLGMEYDYVSAMHYENWMFSNTSGKITMAAKDDPSRRLGGAKELTNLDYSKINRLYECDVVSTLLNEERGTLKSANYPSPYPNNAKSYFLIRTGSQQVSLKFEAFDIQSSPQCSADYIKIYDGSTKSSPVLLEKSCGTGKHPPLIASGRALLLEFLSDGAQTATGFKALYETVECGGTYTTPLRNITSPNYPKDYPPSKVCLYLISAPPSYTISLRVVTMDIEKSRQCRRDYLEIYNGDSTSAPLLGRFCGSLMMCSPRSNGNSMLLRFVTNGDTQGKGFLLRYSWGKNSGTNTQGSATLGSASEIME